MRRSTSILRSSASGGSAAAPSRSSADVGLVDRAQRHRAADAVEGQVEMAAPVGLATACEVHRGDDPAGEVVEVGDGEVAGEAPGGDGRSTMRLTISANSLFSCSMPSQAMSLEPITASWK